MKNLFASLVCIGVCVEENLLNEILTSQNPYRQKRGGLGYGLHATIQTISEISVSRGVNVRINQRSPIYLVRNNNELEIIYNSKTIAVMRPFRPAEWIDQKLSSGRYVSEVIQQHTASNLVGIIGPTRCPLFDLGTACTFCEMKGGSENTNRSTKEIIEAISIILKYRKNYVLTFTTPLMSNIEFESVCNSLKEIHDAFPEIPLALESQPAPKHLIERIKKSGVDTWMVPLDCYSENSQRAYIPGKQDILRNFYWQSLPYAVSLFGIGNVVSNLIVGLDLEYYAEAAIYQMIERNVIPDLVPIRPSINFVKETDPKLFERLQIYLRERLATSGLINKMSRIKSGCAACGGCSAGFTVNTLVKKS